MKRRQFLLGCSSACAHFALPLGSGRLARAAEESQNSFLLSKQGCGRATGYAEANKIVTFGDKTHVAWLDSPAEGFRVRVRTLDRRSGEWSPTYTVGQAYDNHGGPALTADREGFLHIVYYPHHHPMRYRKSRRPNDASAWEEEVQFGQRCTYPTLVCGPDNTLYFSCRRSFADQPWQVELWTKATGKAWNGPLPLIRSRYQGYSHFQESLAWSPDHRTLHLGCRIHENSDKTAYGRLQTVGYLASDDLGHTWRRSDGTAVQLPATAQTVDVLAAGGLDHDRILRAGGLGVDRSGTPHLIYSVQEKSAAQTIVSTPQDDGSWRGIDLRRHLPNPWYSWDLIMPGAVTFNRVGEMFVAAQVQRTGPDEESWGHSSNEVVCLRSSDGGTSFQFELISQADETISHWLPNIERPAGHHEVVNRPVILYTAGAAGQKNTDLLANRVVCSY